MSAGAAAWKFGSGSGVGRPPARHRQGVVRAALFAALNLAIGCGPSVSLRVSQRSLKDLPIEARLDLLDAENDLFSAIDRRDDAEQAIEDARLAVKRAQDRISEAEHSEERARDQRDATGAAVGRLALEEARARKKAQEAAVEVARKLSEVEEAHLLVAQARFERARADVAKKAKTAGAAELKLADFDKQVSELSKQAKAVEAEADRTQKSAEKDRARWQELSHQLAEQTGGALGSAWVQ